MNILVSLGEYFTASVKAQVGQGRRDGADDVIRAVLHLLEEQEAKFIAMRAALVHGEHSGVSTRDVRDVWGGCERWRVR